ncbi:cyclic AMP-dependent transcription factor ATF-6 beta-like [Patiria miniata]|uniref:BZIP domain-containing protein n=1 Tax=Patiria miniata TaxID=46514 RepID=A0A914AJU8_PATMI|nr:cyclic AMP-dependent transcription factor ATF-6 beta-like [Patiria miniata]
MAMDFISTPDTRFLADNLLSSEDWADDFSHFHDNGLGNGFSDADDLMRDFTSFETNPISNDNTGHGMLDESCLSDFTWMKEDEHNPCTIEGIIIKSEPLSPPPSSSSSDASGDSFPPVTNFHNPLLQVKLESPPLTPPRDNADIQHFPLSNGSVKAVPRIAPKVAPKVASQQQQGSTTKPLAVGQPIVLTQADVARLTAQGVIKCQPPPAKQAKVAHNHTVASIPVAAKPDDHQQVPPNIDVRAWKRQQRMIKNRESACLSRKKKKEYLQGLEGKMESIDQENTRLHEENCLLRKRVEELTIENNRLRKLQSLLPSSNKTATCLLAVLLLLGFNLAPFSIFSSEGGDYATTHHGGRALLGYTENPQTLSQLQDSDLQQHTDYGRIEAAMHNATDGNGAPRNPLSRKELMVIRDMADYMLSKEEQPSCPQLNMTESHRLADVLMGWAQKHQDEQRKHNQEQKIKEKKRKTPKKKPAKRNPFRRRDPQPIFVDPDETGLQVYDSLFQRTYDNLLDSLERRDDTFYVVSFRRDHTLLPATAHNNTKRPRMSLVMPSVGVNESSLNKPRDHISMMQIDCEVMNTKMVYLKESHIPSTRNTTVTNHTGTKPSTHGDTHRVTVPTSEGTKKFYHPKNIPVQVPVS